MSKFVVLAVFAGAFLMLTIFTGSAVGDYRQYLLEWRDLLTGSDPWNLARINTNSFNAYGPLFIAFAPLTLLHPLLNKILFAGAYVAFIIWLLRGVRVTSPPILFTLLNPLPWTQVASLGFFDVLIGIMCVGAVHCIKQGRHAASGLWLGTGILLKYLPVLVLPFLALGRPRILKWCAGLVIPGFIVSVMIWGVSVFTPLTFAMSRPVRTFTIYALGAYMGLNTDILANACLAVAGLSVFAWCAFNRTQPTLSALMAVLVTLLFYRTAFDEYQMTLYCIAAYWAVSEWDQLKEELAVMLAALYFTFVAVVDVNDWFGAWPGFRAEMALVVVKFFLGFALLMALMRLAYRNGVFAVERRTRTERPLVFPVTADVAQSITEE